MFVPPGLALSLSTCLSSTVAATSASRPYGCAAFCPSLGTYPSRRGFLALTATQLTVGTMPFSSINTTNNPQEKKQNGPLATDDNNKDPVRIAIIGGGIAGITAAQAIANHLSSNRNINSNNNNNNPLLRQPPPPEVVVFEADAAADTPFEGSFNTAQPPRWTAATARNANSMVPGAAMHIMSQRSTLWQIAHDTVSEWAALKYEQGMQWLGHDGDDDAGQLSIDKFEVPPPYFAFHVLQCVGPNVSWPQRRSFFTFFRQFVQTSLWTGPTEADERAKHIVQLAKANRAIFLRDYQTLSKNKSSNDMGMGRGFISLHRTLEKAKGALHEAEQFGERAELLSWDQALQFEPRLRNLPFGPIYAVHRPDDVTANCLTYTQALKQQCLDKWNVQFRGNTTGTVTSVERTKPQVNNNNPSKRFRITTADGSRYETDYVVLAAGINTPLFAQQLDAGRYCPTYPLRGYSMTLYVNDETIGKAKLKAEQKEKHNLLHRPISVDQMYCTSVSPHMARLAGYGELVGYREAATHVPSVGPRVMARYGQAIFPQAINAREDSAVQCFRPFSPDDLPLVGKVTAVPGLYLHHGHGTLGWTLCLATAECVVQALVDDMQGIEESKKKTTFVLPDQTHIARSVLSPDRF